MKQEKNYPEIQNYTSDVNHNLIAYEGPFFIDLLTMFGNYLDILTDNNTNNRKKIFKVYMELSQNVANYSEEYILLENKTKKVGIGELRVNEDNSYFRLTTKNLVNHKDANVLLQRCHIINNSSVEHLKDLKRELRKTATGIKLGARIGLLQAKLISNNNLEFGILEKNRNYSYFKLTVKFNKNEKHSDR